jgi:hypothetical protein
MSQPTRGTLVQDGTLCGPIITIDGQSGQYLAFLLRDAIGREVTLFGPYTEERGDLYWVLKTTDGDRL